MEPSKISHEKGLLDEASAELHNSVIDEDKCIPEISTTVNKNPSESISLQCKLEDLSPHSLEDDEDRYDEQLRYDKDKVTTDSLSMPTTSGALAQSSPIKTQFETMDFIEKRNIILKNIECCTAINGNNKKTREYYESIRPMVSGKDSNTFSPSTKHCKFTVMNYNILSQELISANMFLYTECKKEYLEWEYRWNLLQHEITKVSPSILTLQEIYEQHYASHFLPWLTSKGYKGIYKKKTGNKMDGCAVFFKADLFNVIEHISVQYHQESVRALNRHNIALIVKLTPKDFYEPFCVSTTHFLFNPSRSDLRLLQMTILLAELDRFCYTGEEGGIVQYCPVILTGDFNSAPSSALVQFLCKGKLTLDRDSESLLRGNGNPRIANQIIPPSLGISNYCHHNFLDKERRLGSIRGSLFSLADRRKREESLISLDMPDHQPNSSLPNVGYFSGSPGKIHHRFNFESVYDFTPEEVTTLHTSWIMVDYIFYTQRDKKSRANPLALLEKYQLPGLSFTQIVGNLPSEFCPSDHFPLAATFALSKQSSGLAKEQA